jgi:hypothetical protein
MINYLMNERLVISHMPISLTERIGKTIEKEVVETIKGNCSTK